MNHKILFVDLDATLLSDDKTVSEENRAAIQKMLLAGHDIGTLHRASGGERQGGCERTGADAAWLLYDRL